MKLAFEIFTPVGFQIEKHAVNVNVDMFGIGNILDNPKKKRLGHPFVTISNIYKYPVVKQHPLKCFPCTESSQKKSSRHVLPDKSGGTWSSTSSPSSQFAEIWYERHLLMLQNFKWPALRLVVSPTIYRGFSSSKKIMQEFFQRHR